jgi:hypothetical protein
MHEGKSCLEILYFSNKKHEFGKYPTFFGLEITVPGINFCAKIDEENNSNGLMIQYKINY